MKDFISVGHLFQHGMLVLLLITARIAPVVQLVPYLGGKATPQSVKTTIAFALSGLIFPVVWTSEVLPTGFGMALLIAKEVMVGLTMGFIGALVFEAIRIAGQIIDTVRGQNMATALVPQLPDRSSGTGDALYLLFVAIFLVSGAHHLLLTVLLRSYIAVPISRFPDMEQVSDVGMLVARLFGNSFELALVIAFPVVLTVLMADVVLAMVNRAAPQVQVFFLGMPLKAALGLFVVLICVEGIMQRLMQQGVEDISALQTIIEGWAE
jgi:flagellar biosynthetic protein FliR